MPSLGYKIYFFLPNLDLVHIFVMLFFLAQYLTKPEILTVLLELFFTASL